MADDQRTLLADDIVGAMTPVSLSPSTGWIGHVKQADASTAPAWSAAS